MPVSLRSKAMGIGLSIAVGLAAGGLTVLVRHTWGWSGIAVVMGLMVSLLILGTIANCYLDRRLLRQLGKMSFDQREEFFAGMPSEERLALEKALGSQENAQEGEAPRQS